MGPIIPTFEERIIYDSMLPRNAKVSSIIHNGTWRWPPTNSPDLLTLKQTEMSPDPGCSSLDVIRWKPSPSGTFTTQSTWKALRVPKPAFTWHKLVWFSKTRFILWLAIKERLGSQDHLHSSFPNQGCLLCGDQEESHNHLFFKCPFSSAV